MKNKSILSVTSLIALTLGLSACGESFQGRYQGDAISLFQVGSSCFSGAQPGTAYSIEVVAQVSGDDVEVTIASLNRKIDQGSDILALKMTGISAGAPLVSDTRFANDAQSFENSDEVYATTEGVISTTRDQIDNLVVTYNGIKADGSPCQNGIKANSLTLVP